MIVPGILYLTRRDPLGALSWATGGPFCFGPSGNPNHECVVTSDTDSKCGKYQCTIQLRAPRIGSFKLEKETDSEETLFCSVSGSHTYVFALCINL